MPVFPGEPPRTYPEGWDTSSLGQKCIPYPEGITNHRPGLLVELPTNPGLQQLGTLNSELRTPNPYAASLTPALAETANGDQASGKACGGK